MTLLRARAKHTVSRWAARMFERMNSTAVELTSKHPLAEAHALAVGGRQVKAITAGGVESRRHSKPPPPPIEHSPLTLDESDQLLALVARCTNGHAIRLTLYFWGLGLSASQQSALRGVSRKTVEKWLEVGFCVVEAGIAGRWGRREK